MLKTSLFPTGHSFMLVDDATRGNLATRYDLIRELTRLREYVSFHKSLFWFIHFDWHIPQNLGKHTKISVLRSYLILSAYIISNFCSVNINTRCLSFYLQTNRFYDKSDALNVLLEAGVDQVKEFVKYETIYFQNICVVLCLCLYKQ